MMRLRALSKDAVVSLRTNPRSSVLCVCAIVLAVATFAAVSSIAAGMTSVVGRRFDSLGARALVISSIEKAREQARCRHARGCAGR
jgi:hypothetical protein